MNITEARISKKKKEQLRVSANHLWRHEACVIGMNMKDVLLQISGSDDSYPAISQFIDHLIKKIR